MGIQGCKNCGTKFNYMDLQKSLWLGYKPINCRNCGVEHALKMRYRFVFAIPMALPVSLRYFRYKINSLAPTMTSFILTYIVYVAVIASLCPFIFRYNLEEKRIKMG